MNSGYSTPHRGVLILVLGILGLVFCQFISPFAWAMGKSDMEKIDQGLTAPEGRGLTQAGMICGICGTAMIIFALLTMVLLLLFAVVSGAIV